MLTCAYDRPVAALDFSDDAVLVKALAARDRDAFAYLLDRYHSTLVRLAQQYVPSRAVAEEVVQETWLAVIDGIDRFEQRSSLKTWLFRILVNIARSHGVRRRTARFRSRPPPCSRRNRPWIRTASGASHCETRAWKRPPHPWSEPEQRALDAETLETIRAAVERLPPDQREVITMRDLLGWSAAEVCDALEVSDANQRVLLHRARSKVRAALERHYDHGPER